MDNSKAISRELLILTLIVFGAIYYALNASTALITREEYKILNAGFLSIIFFIFLFTSFQYFQNKDKVYLYYSLYLISTLLYFINIFPEAFPFPMGDHLVDFVAGFDTRRGSEAELTLSLICVFTYSIFIQSFLEIGTHFPRINRLMNYGYWILVVYIIVDIIII